uniref:C-CAP/cofactor C-like domain-containing protein n=1 Tax=Syphacia muris TaxID=451379 RepID=A0A0N5AQ12_9BILA
MDVNEEESDINIEDKKKKIFEHNSRVPVEENLFESKELDELRTQAKLALANTTGTVDPVLLERIESALSLISGGFEARCFRDLYDQLVARLQQCKKPKSTFQFASKVSSKKPVVNLEESNLSSLTEDAPPTVQKLKGSKVISDLKSEQLSVQGIDGEDVTIVNIVDSSVHTSFSASIVQLKGIKNSVVVFAPIQSSVLIRGCSGVTIVAAAQQIRIHDSHDLELHIAVRGAVIIENCDGIKVAPYKVRNIKLDWENDNWKDVKDFDWLSSEQNPHWSIMDVSLWKTFDLN